MTLPPQGPDGSQSAGGGGPQWGGPPPQGPGGQPPYGSPGGQWPPQPWGAPPPPNQGGKGKWILVGLALVAIIAVSIVGTVLVLRPDAGGAHGEQSNTANGGSEFASADDTGPANIITEEPTCEAWGKIADGMEAAVPGWNEQDYSVAATEWTPEQRSVFEKKSAALTDAIPNVTSIAKQTPHRVMRELYGQYIVYAQAVIDAVPKYASTDHYVVAASNRLAGALNRICDAIYFRAAQQTAPLIPPAVDPSDVQVLKGDDKLGAERFVNSGSQSCTDWITAAERFDKDTEAWRKLGVKTPATEWTPEQKSGMDAVVPVMTAYADDMERLGRQSGNAVFEDFAVFAAQYLRAYVQGIPTFTPNITYMSSVSVLTSNFVHWACKAVS